MPSDKLKSETWLHFRAVLSTRMRELDLNGSELAQRVRVNASSVTGWLKEGSLPRGQALMDLAKVLGVQPEALVLSSSRTAPPPRDAEEASAYLTGGRVALGEVFVALKELQEQLLARWERQVRGQAVADSAAHQQRHRAPKRRSRGT